MEQAGGRLGLLLLQSGARGVTVVATKRDLDRRPQHKAAHRTSVDMRRLEEVLRRVTAPFRTQPTGGAAAPPSDVDGNNAFELRGSPWRRCAHFRRDIELRSMLVHGQHRDGGRWRRRSVH